MTDRVLVIDDDPRACELLSDSLRDAGFSVLWTRDDDAGLALARDGATRVVVAGIEPLARLGESLRRECAGTNPGLAIVVVDEPCRLSSAPPSLRSIAHALVAKPATGPSLVEAVRRAALSLALPSSARPGLDMNGGDRFGDLIGTSPAMLAAYELIERVASSDLPVLITGESGTGKELVARELHRRSSRASGPFVAVNCAALPEALLESELFGHARGAFTDARAAREGLFTRANGGTILLDEIGDMPLGLQPKLLRALEEGAVRPLGSSEEVPFDARVVTATHRDLEQAIERQSFREDLYYRVNVIQIPLPPLRRRGSDVLLLAHRLLKDLAAARNESPPTISPAVRDRLVRHEWRGNVRELRNCVERALTLCHGQRIELSDLPPQLLCRERTPPRPSATSLDFSALDLVPLEEVERRYILHVLDACGGNKSIAARLLGLNRKTLYRRLDTFGVHRGGSIDPPASSDDAPRAHGSAAD